MLACILLLALATVQCVHAHSESPAPLTGAGSMAEMLIGCGVTKSCFTNTASCVAANSCVLAVTVAESSGLYWFELRTLEGVYAAVALSADNKMGDDAVVECVYDDVTGQVETFVSWNQGHSNTRLDTPPAENGITVLETSRVDGSVYCKFTRRAVTTVHGHLFDLQVAPYHLLVAAGTSLKPSAGSVGFHDIAYSASSHSQYLHRVGVFDGGDGDAGTPEDNMAAMTLGCGRTLACFSETAERPTLRKTVSVAATIMRRNDLYIFEMRTTVGVFIAVGLSRDGKMGSDSVVDCRYNATAAKVVASVSWNNDDHTNTRLNSTLEESGISLLDSSYNNGSVYCKFTRQSSTVAMDTTFDLDFTPYFLLLSAGTSLTPGGDLEQHDLIAAASSHSQYLDKAGLFDGNTAAGSLRIQALLLSLHVAIVAHFTIN